LIHDLGAIKFDPFTLASKKSSEKLGEDVKDDEADLLKQRRMFVNRNIKNANEDARNESKMIGHETTGKENGDTGNI
jgi:hypothetical protein